MELINAVKEGNLELVKKLLKVNETDAKSEDYKVVSVDCHGTFTCKRGLDTFVITQEGLKHLLLNELNKNN